MTATSTFGEWALDLSIDEIPEEVIRAAKRHLLDGFGCAVGAARLGEVPFATAVALSMPSPEQSTIIGSGHRVPAPMAATANGALVHALDYDDTHAEALVHATAAVLPAALAAGEDQHSAGADVMAAAIAGYELVIRLGSATRHGFHSRGFHATSVCGVFSAALIACRLSKCTLDATVNALGIAGSAASGSLEFLSTGSSTKQLHPGMSGMNGLIAARLAAEGASGPSSILEGSNGFFKAYAGADVDPMTIVDGLGSRWETSRITIKPYPACQLSHASIDALASIREQLDVDQISSIVFDVPADSVPIVCEPADVKMAPRTSYEGKFSLPFTAAAYLVAGQLRPESFEEVQLSSRETLRIAGMVGYRITHPNVAAAEAPGKVEVTTRNGDVIVGEVPASRGGPRLPLSDDQVIEKFLSNCGNEYPATEITETILKLDDLEDLSRLMSLTRPRVISR